MCIRDRQKRLLKQQQVREQILKDWEEFKNEVKQDTEPSKPAFDPVTGQINLANIVETHYKFRIRSLVFGSEIIEDMAKQHRQNLVQKAADYIEQQEVQDDK